MCVDEVDGLELRSRAGAAGDGGRGELEARAEQQRPRSDERARRERTVEIPEIHRVEGCEVGHVGGEDRHHHQIGGGHPGRLQHPAQVVEHQTRFSIEGGGRFAGGGIDPDAAGQVQRVAGAHRVAERPARHVRPQRLARQVDVFAVHRLF